MPQDAHAIYIATGLQAAEAKWGKAAGKLSAIADSFPSQEREFWMQPSLRDLGTAANYHTAIIANTCSDRQ